MRTRKWRIATLALVLLLALVAPGFARADETSPNWNAICQAGEVCLWPSSTDYNDYWDWVEYEDCVNKCVHAANAGSDGSFGGYFKWPTGNTVLLNNGAVVAQNRGISCQVFLYTSTYGFGIRETLSLNEISNWVENPGQYSSNHWCTPW